MRPTRAAPPVGSDAAPSQGPPRDEIAAYHLMDEAGLVELLDDLAKMQDGESARLASVANRLFGDDFKTVMDGLRGENGRVSLEAASGFISELLTALAPNS